MIFMGTKGFVAGLAITKGVIVAVVLTALDIGFLKTLAVAVVSASISGVFLLISTYYIVKHTQGKEIREDVADVKRSLGTSRRQGDNR